MSRNKLRGRPRYFGSIANFSTLLALSHFVASMASSSDFADFAAAAGLDLEDVDLGGLLPPGLEESPRRATLERCPCRAARLAIPSPSGIAALDLFAFHDAAVQADGAIFIRSFITEASVEALTVAICALSPLQKETKNHLSPEDRGRLTAACGAAVVDVAPSARLLRGKALYFEAARRCLVHPRLGFFSPPSRPALLGGRPWHAAYLGFLVGHWLEGQDRRPLRPRSGYSGSRLQERLGRAGDLLRQIFAEG